MSTDTDPTAELTAHALAERLESALARIDTAMAARAAEAAAATRRLAALQAAAADAVAVLDTMIGDR
ncbi:hypothetical protein F3168_03450 [Polymorphobacter fuscus]|uniref:DUF4164 family protein n=1 Tax=Sandarakinorhabdus fusca TaxID=1439888 RepID=A0A7C9GMV4_9SPHN|nr:hypothetical protein F9290_03450 [Polymorphobacter fuscus]MQT16312.1 hypothetical protein [Polymorphobacter fuscus]